MAQIGAEAREHRDPLGHALPRSCPALRGAASATGRPTPDSLPVTKLNRQGGAAGVMATQ